MGESNGLHQSNKIGNKLFEALEKQSYQVDKLENLVDKLCSAVDSLVNEVKSMNTGILTLLRWCLMGGFILFTVMMVAITGVWIHTSTVDFRKEKNVTDR